MASQDADPFVYVLGLAYQELIEFVNLASPRKSNFALENSGNSPAIRKKQARSVGARQLVDTQGMKNPAQFFM